MGGKEEGEALDFALPCGYCRQFMQEFVHKDFKIIVYKSENEIKTYSIEELLPHGFNL